MDTCALHQQIESALRKSVAAHGGQSQAARALGLGPGGQALISKLLRGERVSDGTLRTLGRAVGVLPPPRKVLRRAMSREEAAAWDALSRGERLRRLTGELSAE